MLRFVVRRLLLLIPILLGVSLLVFGWIRALPGDPAQALLGERATPERIAQIRHDYGLDQPLYVQYGRYVERVVRLDLGVSTLTRVPVTTELKERFPATVELTIAAMLFAMLFGIPLGFVAAKRYGGVVDHASLVVSLLGVSMPIFLLGLVL
jgi:peptide/nickel transport system permease protein